jgi:hypothetical protein
MQLNTYELILLAVRFRSIVTYYLYNVDGEREKAKQESSLINYCKRNKRLRLTKISYVRHENFYIRKTLRNKIGQIFTKLCERSQL